MRLGDSHILMCPVQASKGLESGPMAYQSSLTIAIWLDEALGVISAISDIN